MLPIKTMAAATHSWMSRHVSRTAILLIIAAVLATTGRSTPCAHVNAADPGAGIFKDCRACPEMVVIPRGTFIMGSPETEKGRDADEGQHTVVIPYAFAVSKGPITWDQWDACVRDGICEGPAVEAALRLDRDGKPIQNYVGHAPGNHPVVGVSWHDAQAFIRWINTKTGKEKYRLLSESEFEYAARAGTTTVYWWGDEPSHDYANYGKDAGQDVGGMAEGRDKWEGFYLSCMLIPDKCLRPMRYLRQCLSVGRRLLPI